MNESFSDMTENTPSTGHDPDWFCALPTHAEALARLLIAVQSNRTPVLLAGPGGSGKTTVLRALEHVLFRSGHYLARVDAGELEETELLWRICGALRLAPDHHRSSQRLWQILEDSLRGMTLNGLPITLILDEPKIDRSSVPLLNRLIRLSSDTRLGLVLSTKRVPGGEYQTLLDRIELLAALQPLNAEETSHYIDHHLSKALKADREFESGARRMIHTESRGLPRQINRLCELTLLTATEFAQSRIDESLVETVSRQLIPAF